MPIRIQRKRTKGWKMPEGAVYVGRTSGEYGFSRPYRNPFRVGGHFKMGNGGNGFVYLEAYQLEAGFTTIETKAQAVEWFKEYRRRYPYKPQELEAIRGRDLACWCGLDEPCHADVLLEIANSPEAA